MRDTRLAIGIMVIVATALAAVAAPTAAYARSSTGDDSSPHVLSSADVKSPNIVTFRIQNYKSKKYLQPSGGSTAIGAAIVQQPAGGGIQLWVDLFDGTYDTFVNNQDGLAMGIDHASTSPGANAIQAAIDGTTNQDWHVVYRTSTLFEFHNRKSGLCLGISGASTANGAHAAQFACDGSTNQGWQLIG